MTFHLTDFTPAWPFNPKLAPFQRRYSAVLRFESIGLHDLWRILIHELRAGGDLSHVNRDKSDHNRYEYGDLSAIPELIAKIESIKLQNQAQHVAALRARRRTSEANELEAAEPPSPWHGNTNTPLREGILTVHKAWFGGSGVDAWNEAKVEMFRLFAMAFIIANFPDDQLIYASSHSDEESFHIHFLVAVWETRYSKSRGWQCLLRADANPLLRDYELAQDLAGAHFAPLGLVRPKRHAAARRDYNAKIRAAELAGEELNIPRPVPPLHVSPSRYRLTERKKARLEADAVAAARQEDWRVAIKKLKKRHARAIAAQSRQQARNARVIAAEASKIAALQETSARLSNQNDRLSDDIVRRSLESELRAADTQETAEVAAAMTRKAAEDEAKQIVEKAQKQAEIVATASNAKIDELTQKELALRATCDALTQDEQALKAKCGTLERELGALANDLQDTKTELHATQRAHSREKDALDAVKEERATEDNARDAAIASSLAARQSRDELQKEIEDLTRRETEAKERLQAVADQGKAAVEVFNCISKGVLEISPDGRIGFGPAAPLKETGARKQIVANYKASAKLVNPVLAAFRDAVETRVAQQKVELAKMNADLAEKDVKLARKKADLTKTAVWLASEVGKNAREASVLTEMREAMGLKPDDTLADIQARHPLLPSEDAGYSLEP
ncbi:hypothetical protein [Roseicyclus marinus]|uniref:hypothetical protein n=1 Tax=Roseicyclus marinus TaxID=2161673 RepID=UPI00240EA70C|nr:hypothetical protein [Roseicyclus marinus]MDG3042479.1 hypothetical protein [Roseicyclus marinus]